MGKIKVNRRNNYDKTKINWGNSKKMLESLLKQVKLKGEKLYLMIDGYHHFANSILAKDKNIFNEITIDGGFERKDFVSLLYYLGYITISENVVGEYRFVIPNKRMEQIFEKVSNNLK